MGWCEWVEGYRVLLLLLVLVLVKRDAHEWMEMKKARLWGSSIQYLLGLVVVYRRGSGVSTPLCYSHY